MDEVCYKHGVMRICSDIQVVVALVAVLTLQEHPLICCSHKFDNVAYVGTPSWIYQIFRGGRAAWKLQSELRST
eukprot:667868-Amphidinium_carterae.2